MKKGIIKRKREEMKQDCQKSLRITPLPSPELYERQQLGLYELIYTPIERICFRGDSRKPKEVFKSGLYSRPEQNNDSLLSYGIVFPFTSANRVGVSKRLSTATLFPYPSGTESWLYVVALEKGFDVHSHGIIYSQLAKKPILMEAHPIQNGMKINIESLFKFSYSEEIITPGIPSSHIICAIKVKKTLIDPIKISLFEGEKEGGFQAARGIYELEEEVYNPDCILPQDWIEGIKTFIANEKRLGPQRLPEPSSAYHSVKDIGIPEHSQPRLETPVSEAAPFPASAKPLSNQEATLSKNRSVIRLPLPEIYKKPVVKKSELVYSHIQRICFRGDRRDPEQIFKDGFQPLIRDDCEDDGVVMPFASHNHVCVSKRLTTATLFPYPAESESWLYVVALEKGFDVHSHGIIYLQLAKKPILMAGANPAQKGMKLNMESLFKYSYSEEIITPSIPSSHIICAIKVKKTFIDPINALLFEEETESNFQAARGTYELQEEVYNRDCSLPEEWIEGIKTFIANEKRLGPQRLPEPSSAYHAVKDDDRGVKPQADPAAIQAAPVAKKAIQPDEQPLVFNYKKRRSEVALLQGSQKHSIRYSRRLVRKTIHPSDVVYVPKRKCKG